jgi:hypothetical protein
MIHIQIFIKIWKIDNKIILVYYDKLFLDVFYEAKFFLLLS